jgi:hypothetical protein
MTNIKEIQENIDNIKEYINTEICIKCEKMKNLLNECEQLLIQAKNNAHTT